MNHQIKLTKRETEILQRIADEKTSQTIANELEISIRTVETHRKNLLVKVGVGSAVGLVKFAIIRGLVPGFAYSD